MSHIDFIGPDGEKWPSATELTNLLPQTWVWGWYKSQVKKHGWRGWLKCLAQSNRGKRIGTLVHALLDGFINGKETLYDPNEKYNAQLFADALFDKVNPLVDRWVATEQHVVSNASRLHGTADMIVALKDKQALRVGDWKTGADKSDTHPIQLAIYALCWNESHPECPVNDGFISRVDKKSKKLTVKIDEYDNLTRYYPVIQALRTVYDYTNSLGMFKEQDNVWRNH